jgi:hypothetical protein
MSTVSTPSMTLRDSIVSRVRDRQQSRPTDLIRDLSTEYPAAEIKQMLLRLLQDGDVELTAEMQLMLTDQAA